MSDSGLSCYLIGVESLLIECAQILRAQGFAIRGVISDADRITAWSREQGLPVIDPRGDGAALRSRLEAPFDYLFAVGQYEVLPEAVLALPAKGAILFHDGPLPRYSGLNVPVWALIEGATTHGITWHDQSAAGEVRVLKTRSFEVAETETTLTLNTKCFEAGIDSFRELAAELREGTARAVSPEGDGRHYAADARPPAFGTLDLTRPAAELEALVRALDFGPYDNPMGVAKLYHDGKLAVVTQAEAIDDDSAAPGEVLELSDEALVLGTGRGRLVVLAGSCPYGNPLGPRALAQRLGVSTGDRLAPLDPALRARLDALSPTLAAAEGYWIERLRALDPLQLPYPVDAARGGHERRGIALPEPFVARFGERRDEALAAAAVVYLARLGQKRAFHLGYGGAALHEQIAGLSAFLATRVPLAIDLPEGLDFDGARGVVRDAIAAADRGLSWLHDLAARAPALKGRSDLAQSNPLPLSVQLRARPEDFTPREDDVLALLVSGGELSLVHTRGLPARVVDAIAGQLGTLLAGIGAAPETPLAKLPLLSQAERDRILVEWNRTEANYDRAACMHTLFEAQARRTPEATAVVFEGEQLGYRELDERSNRLAAKLRQLGIGPDRMVGVCVERSLDLMVAILGTQKAGGAYVPLDPDYPAERIAFMIEDSRVPVLITQAALLPSLPESSAQVVCIDRDWPEIAALPAEPVDSGVRAQNLAYVIYTSGSTGRPKGVMVEHQNAVNFFAGMDPVVAHEPPGTWLAVTSLSFDISVLELFWTLAHGFAIVLYRDRTAQGAGPAARGGRKVDFGLFMWGADDKATRNKYDLMLESAKFADAHGFVAVWTPERHFHAFGGPYPNPSVTGAAIGAVTERVQVRAGSCVAPLHHPARVAEEWSVVDNITGGGRVGVAFASGWQPDDFLLRPENFKQAKQALAESIDTVRKLWRGESVSFPGPLDKPVEVLTQPRPLSPELPFWVTTAGNPDTYKQAGALGANVLTHLLGQSLEEVGEKIRIYRRARADAGLDPDAGVVTLMLHTYVGDDIERVREIVREPMKHYLATSVALIKNFAWSFSAFKRPAGATTPMDIDLQSLSEEEMDAILEAAFARYFETSGLFGTPESCVEMVQKASAHGIDEIACLIDFGVPTASVLDGLSRLEQLKRLCDQRAGEGALAGGGADFSIPALIERHGVSHLQCTPSMARMLVSDPASRKALRSVKHLMVGGEAFPVDLAHELTDLVSGTVTNMYGPTETTIWSSTQRVEGKPDNIPIGRPIANTQLYILDEHREPVPAGVPGELWIGGDGVVRGYHERPELTAERFVDDPFRHGGAAGGARARIYRTGDVARFRDDGVVEYLGRTDHQVKLRGFRIELGEIETRLAELPEIAQSVVIAREDTPGDQRLVAYVVPAGAKDVDAAAVREHLRARLPEYMVPQNVVQLDRLPLTPNGKIDRKQLPAPSEVAQQAAGPHVEPAGELEAMIAQKWCETLGLSRVSSNDNFFDIGGHSLLVVQLHRRLQPDVKRPLSLTDLYRFPTVAALANYLASDGGSADVKKSADRAQRRRELLQKRRRRR